MEELQLAEGQAAQAASTAPAAAVPAASVVATPTVSKAPDEEGAVHLGSSSRLRNGLWAAAGLFFFALGMVGVVLPILPTTPFILVAAFCFARGSARLNTWFKGTKVYKQVLEGYVSKRSMTLKAKLSILVPVTALLAIGFVLMSRVPIGRVVLVVVWACHIVYFGFVVKTDKGSC